MHIHIIKKMKVNHFIQLLFILFCYTGIPLHTTKSMTVRPFSFLNQLPSNDMQCVFQDKEGLIWLGTADGLCRYDGYNVHIFRSSPLNSTLFPNNSIRSIAETKDGKLLIGTSKGLTVFDKHTNRFSTLNLSNDLTGYEVRSIVVDREGWCWIGSYKKLMRLSPDLKTIKTYDKVLPITSVNTVYMDHAGSIWVGFWNKGLFRYDRQNDTFQRFPEIGKHNNPFRVFQDKSGGYWVSTWGDGVYNMYPGKPEGCFQPVRILPGNIGNSDISCVFGFAQDITHGYLWMTDLKGINVYSVQADKSLVPVDMGREMAGIDKSFNNILLDKDGNIWLASSSTGGCMINFAETSSSMMQIPSIAELTNGLSLGITALYQDNRKVFWLNQSRWGLGWYNPADKSLHFYKEIPTLATDRFLTDVLDIFSSPVRPNEVWVIPKFNHFIYVFGLNEGLPTLKHKINLEKVHAGNPIAFYEDQRHFMWGIAQSGIITISPSGLLRRFNLKLADMTSIAGDGNNIWISTNSNGLYRLSVEYANGTYNIRSVEKFNKENGKLPSNDIETIRMDNHRKCLWLGTMEGFVLALGTEKKYLTDYSTYFSGYVNAMIGSITVDKYGHVWASSAKNVVEYNPDDNSMRSYPVQQEEGMTSFIKGATTYNGGDKIYFGGRGGVACFDVKPNSLSSSLHQQVIVTDLKANGHSILDGILPAAYRLDNESKQLVLGPNAKNIEINFSTLDYTNPSHILYAYRLKGINNDWVYTREDAPRAYFNELPKGTFQLEIRTTDENGRWGDNIQVFSIVQLPAWYETWWAYTLYIIMLLGTAWYVYRIIKRRIHLKNELKIAKIENERNEELTQAKLRYFTNVSHDFLTPISIISCLIDDIGMTYKNHIPQLEKMRNSLTQLKRLIQQVLDFRKIENGKMKLSVSRSNLVEFIRKVCRENFEPLMDKKHISFSFDSEETQFMVWFDEDKLEKIVYNLLSNACKYTDEGGTVSVSLASGEDHGHRIAIIKVSDTGRGISKTDCERIFNRFYTANPDKTVESNGIGLALVKELADLHHASVSVQSKLGEGSTFTITIPTDEESYSLKERTSPQKMEDIINLELTDGQAVEGQNGNIILQEAPQQDNTDEKCMLIVDDNQDLLDVMYHIFSRHRKVLLAHNGREALSVISTNAVDIIVSDVMMPEMDGLELCRQLKSNLETSHIPVILLTAKNSPEDRVECYEAGADGYIAKPFDLNVLEARIENFLRRKQQRQTEFKTDPEKKTASLKVSPLDQKFLDKVVSILDKNMEKSNDIDMNLLTGEIAMSKSSFYRKMKAITGLSPIEFIKNHRLKRAYNLLEKGAYSIADVAYSSGFSNTKYFATCFKEEFGMTPSEFLKKNN